MPGTSNRGTLMMIGGAEDKNGDKHILSEVARRSGHGTLVVATVASEEPDYLWSVYEPIFRAFGKKDVAHLRAETREQVMSPANVKAMESATAVFFTGGDQLRITTKLGGTPVYDQIRALYKERGGLVAGTSAGAAAMGQIMLMSPEAPSAERHKLRRAFILARGLSLVRDMVIDQHFAERARIERLLGAIAENPGVLGVGIDEDTAVVVNGACFDVIGSGAVYVADGSGISYTNASGSSPDQTLCLFDVRLHVLVAGTRFDIAERRPCRLGEQG